MSVSVLRLPIKEKDKTGHTQLSRLHPLPLMKLPARMKKATEKFVTAFNSANPDLCWNTTTSELLGRSLRHLGLTSVRPSFHKPHFINNKTQMQPYHMGNGHNLQI